MRTGSDRILTTHVGSLPRPPAVTELLLAKEHEQPYDSTAYTGTIRGAVADIVERQIDTGRYIISDAEMSMVFSSHAAG